MLSSQPDRVSSTLLAATLKAKGTDVSAETIHEILLQYRMTNPTPAVTICRPTDDTAESELTEDTTIFAPTPPTAMIYAEDFANMTTPTKLLENTVIAMETKSPDLSAAILFQQHCFQEPPMTTLLQQGATSLVSKGIVVCS